MSRLFVAAALVALSMAPAESAAQERNLLFKLRAAALDSLPGTVPVYYSLGHQERARLLQHEYSAAVEHYHAAFTGGPALNVRTTLALLDPGHWTEVANRPYGAPHIDLAAWPVFVVVLPASNEEGIAAALWEAAGLSSKVEIARAVDVIGLHEFGHALNVQRGVLIGAMVRRVHGHVLRPRLSVAYERPRC